MSRPPAYRDCKTDAVRPYLRSPLAKEIARFGCSPQSSDEEDGDDEPEYISKGNSYQSNAFGLFASPPSYAPPQWMERSQRKMEREIFKRHHRRISTNSLIALARRHKNPSLTLQRILALFAVVAMASYLARLLPLFFIPKGIMQPAYNAEVYHKPLVAYEVLDRASGSQRASIPYRNAEDSRFHDREVQRLPQAESDRVRRPKNNKKKTKAQPLQNMKMTLKMRIAQKAQEEIEREELIVRNIAHDKTLKMVPVDGVDRAAHEAIASMSRQEASLDEPGLLGEQEASVDAAEWFLADSESDDDDLGLLIDDKDEVLDENLEAPLIGSDGTDEEKDDPDFLVHMHASADQESAYLAAKQLLPLPLRRGISSRRAGLFREQQDSVFQGALDD